MLTADDSWLLGGYRATTVAPLLSGFRAAVVLTGTGVLKAEMADATSVMALLAPPCVRVMVKVTLGCRVLGVCSSCLLGLADACTADGSECYCTQ